jgi:hypothetical protein
MVTLNDNRQRDTAFSTGTILPQVFKVVDAHDSRDLVFKN